MSAGEAEFIECVLRNPNNATILDRLLDLALSDCWLVSGSLFQTVWNVQTARDPTYGIKDYDIFYYDNTDESWEAEDKVIKHCAAIFADLNADVQVRNQARVHLWYEEKFGAPYPKLKSSCDGIDRFTTPSSMYGISRDQDGNFQVYAPHGFEDPFNFTVRPNPDSRAVADVYAAKTQRWKSRWPELTVIPFD